MGYEKAQLTKYEISSNPQRTIGITGVAADITMNSISIPSDLPGRIAYAYLHFECSYIYASVGGSDLDGDQYIQISVDGGSTWHNAILMPDDTLTIGSASTFTSLFPVTGNIDLAAIVSKGDTVQVRWHDALSATGSLSLVQDNTKMILYLA